MDSPPVDLCKKYDKKIWRTVGSRFNAARRLSVKQSWSVFTVSMLSLYNLTISFLQLFDSPFATSPEFSSALSAIMSVFVLILSLLEMSKGYELKAERLHINAMQLNGLYSELQASNNNTESLKCIIMRYHQQLQACPENHDFWDDKLFQAEHYKDFDLKWLHAILIKAFYFLRQRIFYFALLAVPLIFLIFKLILN